MRPALVVALVLAVTACHRPSVGGGFKTLGRGFANLGKGVVRVVKPVTPDVDVNVAGAIVADAGTAVVRQRVADAAAGARPISLRRTVDLGGGGAGGGGNSTPVDRPSPSPTPITTTVTRTTDTSLDLVYKRFHRDGESDRCEAYSGSQDACSAECTALMRDEGMKQLGPNPGKPLSCSCSQGTPCN